MSIEENDRLASEAITTWDRHDIDAFIELGSDDIVWHDVSNPEPYRGQPRRHHQPAGAFRVRGGNHVALSPPVNDPTERQR